MLKKILKYCYFGVFIALLMSMQAFAYLDASAVTYVVYILAGVAIAGGAAISVYWSKIKRWFRRRKKRAAAKKLAKQKAAQGGQTAAVADENHSNAEK